MNLRHLTAREASGQGFRWVETPGGRRRLVGGGVVYEKCEPSRAVLVIDFKNVGPVFLRPLGRRSWRPQGYAQLDMFKGVP